MRLPFESSAIALLLAVVTGGAAQQRSAADTLRLLPGDMVRLEVFPETALVPDPTEARQPLQFEVDHRGQVLLPVAGLIQVAERPFAEVEEEVRRAFAAEFRDAAVRLVPLLRIAVLGEVRVPGLQPVDPTMTFSDVLAAAGGLTESADRGDVRLVRGDSTVVVLTADDARLLREPLRSGDRLLVGRRSWASENLPFLLGAGASLVASVLTALLIR